jgi:integrase
MASVEKRTRDGRVTWLARWRDPDGRQRKRSFPRKSDAERYLTGIEASIHSGAYVDPAAGRLTAGEYATTWLDRQVQLKPSTRARYGEIVRVHILPAFGTVPLARLERSAVTAWVAGLSASGLAGATVRHVHRVLHMILASAVADSRVTRNVASGVPLPRAKGRTKRFLTHEQVAALAEAAGEYGLLVRVLAYCGLRFGELAALRVSSVEPLRRRLTVAESVTEVDGHMVFGEPKWAHARSVPLPRSLVDDLARACQGRRPDDLLFTAPEGGVLMLHNWRRRVFDPAARAVGLDGLTPHELRHTAASLAVSAGANVKSVQRMLGHASAAMTLDVYSGLFDDDLDTVAERMDQAASAARGATGVPPARPEGSVTPLTVRDVRR